jgi:hypothetical protein
MRKISFKEIVDFRNKSDRSKQTYVFSLKSEKKKISTDSGGDYWISSISALSNSYKQNDIQPIIDKKEELEEKYETAEYNKTKIMYKRNIDILYTCEVFDLDRWRPSEKIKFIRKYREHSVVNLEGLQIQVFPTHIFTFKNGDSEEVGAIWFIAKLNGYRKEELGMFTDILYRYLNAFFSENYSVSSKYCIVVDVFRGIDLNYMQIEESGNPQILDSTIEEIKKLM